MKFEWDAAKARANERKHTVSFDEAASIFRGFCLHRSDSRHNYGEPRFIAVGVDSNRVVLSVVHNLRGEAIRIISAWKASRHEREAYQKARDDRPL
jgi:uncharacterized DUF497 family protein